MRTVRHNFATHMEEIKGKVSEDMHRELAEAYNDLADDLQTVFTTPPVGDIGEHMKKIHADFLEKTVVIRHRYWTGSDVPTIESLREDIRDLVETPIIVVERMGSA